MASRTRPAHIKVLALNLFKQNLDVEIIAERVGQKSTTVGSWIWQYTTAAKEWGRMHGDTPEPPLETLWWGPLCRLARKRARREKFGTRRYTQPRLAPATAAPAMPTTAPCSNCETLQRKVASLMRCVEALV